MIRSSGFRARANQAGVALILVLWTFAVLAALAGEFARAMRQDAQSTANFKQSTIAYYTAVAGINEALLAVVSYNGELDENAIEDDEEQQPETTDDGEGDDVTDDENLALVMTLLKGRGDWISVVVNDDEGGGGVEVELRATAEDGKIPINSNAVDEIVLRQILTSLGYDPEVAATVADSILDWRDDDDLHRESGAEDQYYEALRRPYQAKDGDFSALEELLLVRGVSKEMFYGADERPGLRDIFTVFSRRPRLLESAVSDSVLYALCGPPSEEKKSEFGAEAEEDPAQPRSLSDCLANTDLGIARTRTTRPLLGTATLEARVRGPQQEVLAHIGAVVKFARDGFRTLRWYDAIFSDEG